MLKEALLKALKEGKTLDKDSKAYKAKGDILKEIKALMSDSLAEKMKGMKKITVASPTLEGLKEGLDKAEDVIEAKEDLGENAGKEDMLAKLKKLAAEKAKSE